LSRLLLLICLKAKNIDLATIDMVNSSNEKNFKQPILKIKNQNNSYFISITHRSNFAATTLSEQGVGIDLEIVEKNKSIEFQNYAFSKIEKDWLLQLPELQIPMAQMILWTAKEAMSKCLGTGLLVHPQLFQVKPNSLQLNLKQNYLMQFEGSLNFGQSYHFNICTQIIIRQEKNLVLSSATFK
jgi:phosphopantetheinyl transferase